MAVDFSRLTNTDMNTTPFQYIIFGKGGGLLEVELNEAQLLAYNRQKNTLKLLGNCYRSDDNNTGMFSLSSDKKLVINKGIMVVDGNLFRFPEQVSLNIGLSSNTCTLYAHVSTETLGKDDTVNKFGVEKAGSIDNTILDNRFGIETTKRLSVSLSFDTNSSNGLCIGSFNNGVYSAPDNSNNTVLPVYSMGETKELLDILSSALSSHVNSEGNPHNVTKSQIGLGNVENKSSATIRDELTSGNVTKALGYTPLDSAKKGSANGVAELDSNGLVPSNQLPSYVDDVLEGTATGTSIDATTKAISATGFILTGQSTACTPEKGKIYLDTTTNIQFRWSGSVYISTGSFLALGETGSTAYRGDRGKVAYDHSQKTSGNPHGVTKSDVGLGNVPNVATNDQTVTYSDTSTLATLSSGEKISVVFAKIKLAITNLINHIANKNNPHSVTKSQIGLGSVDNTADLDKPISTSTQTALNDINRNLDVLEYSDVAGGKNIWTLKKEYTSTGATDIINKEELYLQGNNTYTLSFKTTDRTQAMSISLLNSNDVEVLGFNIATNITSINFSINNDVSKIKWYVREAVTVKNIQIEKGTVATDYEPHIPSAKMLSEEVAAQNASLDVLGKYKNLLKLSCESVTTKGVDFTVNKNEGTITLNGTSTERIEIIINVAKLGNALRMVGIPSGSSGLLLYHYTWKDNWETVDSNVDNGSGCSYNESSSALGSAIKLIVQGSGYTFNNVVVKPMVTDNLSATYKDATPYCGSGSTLMANVAGLNESVDGIKNDLGEQKKIYSETTINVGRQAGTTVGDNSTAEGTDTEASGASSHSEGWLSTASNECAHAEGNQTGASGIASHSEGNGTGASGDYSHAEGNGTKADGESSHAEGDFTKAKGNYSHAEGINTTSNGISSHAEGKSTNNAFDYVNEKTSASDIQTAWASNKFSIAKGESAHVEGSDCLALGDYSHAEGRCTIANGELAHSEGYYTQAERHSHASGFYTISLTNQFAIGHSNNTETALENSIYGSGTGTAFVIGNGASPSNRDNAFRVTSDGYTYAKNSYTTSGADYAEYFEWSDENPDSEDRVGYFVTLDEDSPNKIRIANNGDYILGIVSGMPSVIGNGDECWKQRYILDEFGRYIEEEFECEEVVGIDEETGEEIKETKTGTKWKENPDYDPTKPYVPRAERKEWSAVGMVGVLSVRDDGTCKVNGYCKVSDGGIATSAKPTEYIPFTNPLYRVIERVTDNIIKVVIL